MTSGSIESRPVRPSAVAGMFYPGRDDQLSHMVGQLLQRAMSAGQGRTAPVPQAPKALIVPHAGYIYSGSAAADAYCRLRPFARQYRRVVLLGPAHRVAFQGVALPSVEAFETPLGLVPLDVDVMSRLQHSPGVIISDQAHAQEHSLEVQLPFLQSVLDEFKLIPLLIGNASPDRVRQLLQQVWGDDDTLIVVSSDLSHYQDYATAQARDHHTCQAIESLQDQSIGYEDACGCIPVRALLLAAKEQGLRASTVALCNSGDTAGDRSRVVGYGSWVFQHVEH